MLKHKHKILPMLKHKNKILLKKQNYTEKCLRLNTWYTISGVHKYKSYKTLKTLEFLRYKSLYEILSVLVHNNFNKVSALWKRCWVLFILQVFIPLYRGVRETLENCQHIKRVITKLDQSPTIYCLIWLMSYERIIWNQFHA